MTARLSALCGLLALVLALPASVVFAQDEAVEEAGSEASSEQVMYEGELALILVEVLGLSPMLPANPTEAQVYAILVANGVAPRDGWNSENPVNMATLARVLVQSMGREDEVENPDDDAAWVDFLAGIGIEFGTITDALLQGEPLAQPLANAAVEVSTDPLSKSSYIRPTGDQQFGTDLLPIRQPLTREVIEEIVEVVVAAPPAARRPSSRPPMTPN